MKKAAFSLAAGTMVLAPIAASAAPASLESARAAATVQDANQFGEGRGGGSLIAILAVIAVAIGIYLAVDGGDDSPTSP